MERKRRSKTKHFLHTEEETFTGGIVFGLFFYFFFFTSSFLIEWQKLTWQRKIDRKNIKNEWTSAKNDQTAVFFQINLWNQKQPKTLKGSKKRVNKNHNYFYITLFAFHSRALISDDQNFVQIKIGGLFSEGVFYYNVALHLNTKPILTFTSAGW